MEPKGIVARNGKTHLLPGLLARELIPKATLRATGETKWER
jgi:hypothetical protein